MFFFWAPNRPTDHDLIFYSFFSLCELYSKIQLVGRGWNVWENKKNNIIFRLLKVKNSKHFIQWIVFFNLDSFPHMTKAQPGKSLFKRSFLPPKHHPLTSNNFGSKLLLIEVFFVYWNQLTITVINRCNQQQTKLPDYY